MARTSRTIGQYLSEAFGTDTRRAARSLGVSESTIRRWRRGETSPQPTSKRKLQRRASDARRNERAREAGLTGRSQESRIRRESAAWSQKHARSPIARYNPAWSAADVKAYHDAFVNPKSGFNALKRGRASN